VPGARSGQRCSSASFWDAISDADLTEHPADGLLLPRTYRPAYGSIVRLVLCCRFDASGDSEVVWCDIHHHRYLVGKIGAQECLESLRRFDPSPPRTDPVIRLALLCIHLIADLLIVSLVACLEGVQSLIPDKVARVLKFAVFIQERQQSRPAQSIPYPDLGSDCCRVHFPNVHRAAALDVTPP
jgi:hypothetical protein